MMMSSSMASTASVSISSKGKKRLLSLFSLVRTTLRGTAILGQRDSVKEEEEQFENIYFYVYEIRDGHVEVQTQQARTNLTAMTFLAGQERQNVFILSAVSAWERSMARVRWTACIVSPNKATEKVLLY